MLDTQDKSGNHDTQRFCLVSRIYDIYVWYIRGGGAGRNQLRLGSQVAADGGCERDVVHRMNEGCREWGERKSVLSNRGLGIKAKKYLYEGVILPSALYGAGAWGLRSAERTKVNVLEMSV